MRRNLLIAVIAIVAIVLRLVFGSPLPLQWALLIGGAPLVWELAGNLWRREFGSDLLAGISIITAAILGEYLAGTLVVLMLSGGKALEDYAVANASYALQALAKRLPTQVHRKQNGGLISIALDQVKVGDELVIYPQEVAPTDGVVLAGQSVMDEAYLTGEPYLIKKTPGSMVISGAINGEAALTIRATHIAADSRYAKIMQVMRQAEQQRPKLRRLGDQLGAYYTPLALSIAGLTWAISGEVGRFLSVLVVATPCPLLIGIPVSILGAISLAAKRGIIIRNPAIMEQVDKCRTMILDKTGTLTYGEPELTQIVLAASFEESHVLSLAASMEQYSKHPLANSVRQAAIARGIPLQEASEVSEPPGQGMVGVVHGQQVLITNRKTILQRWPQSAAQLPPPSSGLECQVVIDNRYAATLQFHDGPRPDSRPFVAHLSKRHGFNKVMLVSGDRESEVRYLANLVGITEVHHSQSPEQKVAIVKNELQHGPLVFVGDGINDAPALTMATVGIALGQRSDVTSEAAGAVILGNALVKVDELFHISQRMRRIALQSAVGGMALSVVGMFLAAGGWLPAVAGALMQEAIDVLAVLNSLRTSIRPKKLSDF